MDMKTMTVNGLIDALHKIPEIDRNMPITFKVLGSMWPMICVQCAMKQDARGTPILGSNICFITPDMPQDRPHFGGVQ